MLSGYGDVSQGLHQSRWWYITNQTCGWWCLHHFLPHWKNCQEGHRHNKLARASSWCKHQRRRHVRLPLQTPCKAFHGGSYWSLSDLLHMLYRATMALLLDGVAWLLNHIIVCAIHLRYHATEGLMIPLCSCVCFLYYIALHYFSLWTCMYQYDTLLYFKSDGITWHSTKKKVEGMPLIWHHRASAQAAHHGCAKTTSINIWVTIGRPNNIHYRRFLTSTHDLPESAHAYSNLIRSGCVTCVVCVQASMHATKVKRYM